MNSIVKKALFITVIVLCVSSTIAQISKQHNASYVGDSSCEPCHKTQSESFRKNTHNNAYTDIKDTEQYIKLKKEGKEGSCLRCHATGYGENGGFTDEVTTPEQTKVGCESCHGPGSKHAAYTSQEKEFKIRSIQRKPDCGKCHRIHSHEG